MNKIEKTFYVFVLPTLAIILYPPQILFSGLSGIIIVLLTVMAMCSLGLALLRGRSIAITFSIFLQGLNVIIRIMMVFPFAYLRDGSLDFMYIVTILLGLLISFYLMLYMDRQKFRSLIAI